MQIIGSVEPGDFGTYTLEPGASCAIQVRKAGTVVLKGSSPVVMGIGARPDTAEVEIWGPDATAPVAAWEWVCMRLREGPGEISYEMR
jgi:hypothetical protein